MVSDFPGASFRGVLPALEGIAPPDESTRAVPFSLDNWILPWNNLQPLRLPLP